MNRQELIQKSIDIITDYYDHNLVPFFDVIADDVLWLGPRGGQMLRGKEAIITVWTTAETDLQFTMGNIEAETASCGTNNLEVLLEYYVYTHFPDGQIDRHHQRLHYSWGYEKVNGEKVPRVFMIHISNMAEEEPVNSAGTAPQSVSAVPEGMETAGSGAAVKTPGRRDSVDKKGSPGQSAMRVYAASLSESHLDARSLPVFSRIHFRTAMGKGTGEITYFFNSRTILWIESTRGSNHSIVHTTEGSYESIEKLRYFEDRFGDTLLRIHTSFLINPLYLKSIRRFSVTLTDGTVLPVPEKKYTAVRKQIMAWDAAGGRPVF